MKMVINVSVRKKAGNLLTKALVPSEELSYTKLITEARL